MSNITVKFIGREYSIPEDILTYIDLLKFTDGLQEQLTRAFIRKLKKEVDKGNVAYLDDSIMAPHIEQQVGKFITKLAKYGIYDRTINDYLCQNEGYKLIYKVNSAALIESNSALKQQMSDWYEGYEAAIQKKDSSVTGMGFSLWSSSFVNHAIYAAMEASAVNKQEKAAFKEYQKDIAELNARLERSKFENEKRYITNTYLPHMKTAIAMFTYELLDTFISDLIQYDKISKDLLAYTHIERSNDLLNNLKWSQNKEVLLIKAFETCPYNISVYMEAMKYDFLDYESFQTAKFFNHGHTIISFLEKNLNNLPNSKNKRLDFKNVELLSLFSGKSLRELTSPTANFIIDEYAQTINMFTNTILCYNIMATLNETDILAGNSISKQKSDWIVDSLVSVELWNKLTTEYGHTELFERLLNLFPNHPEINTKQEYDSLLKERLFAIFESIRQEREATILNQREAETRRKKEVEECKKHTVEKNKKIKKICLLATIIIFIIAFISTFINNANNIKTVNAKSKENIDIAKSFLGRNFDFNGSITISEEDGLFLNNATLFGINGSYNLGASSSGKSNSTIDLIDWTSDTIVENFYTVTDALKELYGSSYVVKPYFDYSVNTYIWKEVDEYEYVLCWQNYDGSVTIRWTISTHTHKPN